MDRDNHSATSAFFKPPIKKLPTTLNRKNITEMSTILTHIRTVSLTLMQEYTYPKANEIRLNMLKINIVKLDKYENLAKNKHSDDYYNNMLQMLNTLQESTKNAIGLLEKPDNNFIEIKQLAPFSQNDTEGLRLLLSMLELISKSIKYSGDKQSFHTKGRMLNLRVIYSKIPELIEKPLSPPLKTIIEMTYTELQERIQLLETETSTPKVAVQP